MSALIDEAHEFLCIMDKQEYADEVYRLRARVAELEAQIAAPAAAVPEVLRDLLLKYEFWQLAKIDDGRAMMFVSEEQYAALRSILAARQPSQDVVRDANRYRVIRGHLGHVAWKDSDNALIGVGVAKTPGEPYRGNRVADFDAAADALLAASGRQDGAR